jgi:hypothetical protein
VRGVNREWHEDRKDLLGENLIESLSVGFLEVSPGFDVNVLGVERWFY